ncbi:hypothetical protein SEA_FINNY_59 [Microbacterium phage Finny]|uniref:Uncharacterized protein n=1 Tax=Microbacterium phage Finny TaxID=2590878 RepID=A0A4Y6ECG6_9CAUD|nr:hypothetical protein SEA_FINNY_59 [Microbacterium phage Finny]
MSTFTVFASWYTGVDKVIEELDVEASTKDEAIAKAEAELKADYLPGYTIIHCEQRFGLFF